MECVVLTVLVGAGEDIAGGIGHIIVLYGADVGLGRGVAIAGLEPLIGRAEWLGKVGTIRRLRLGFGFVVSFVFAKRLGWLIRLLLFAAERSAVQITPGDDEIDPRIGGKEDAEFAGCVVGGVVGMNSVDEDVRLEEWAAGLDGDEGEDDGDKGGQERESALHGWFLLAGSA